MLRRAAALGLFVAVLAGGLVPCGEPPPDVSAAPVAAASVSDDGAWCGRSEPPQLIPACPCGCEQRPHVAGVPVGVGLVVEASFPVYQSLDGPQLEQDWMVTAGWQYAF